MQASGHPRPELLGVSSRDLQAEPAASPVSTPRTPRPAKRRTLMSAVVSWPMTDLAADDPTVLPAEIGLIPLSDWRAFIQTAMASMLSMLPFAIFIPVAGVHGEESGFGAQWVSLALAMIYAGRIFTIVTVTTLQSYAQWQASLLPDVGGFWSSVCGVQKWLAWAGDAQVLHLVTVSWGIVGAAILLVPAPPAFIAGALCLGVSWAGPLLQLHITRISNGYPNASRQLVTRVWAWRLVGMLLGTSLSGPTYQFLGWPGIMAIVAGSNAAYLLLGLLSLDHCRRRAERGSDKPRRLAISAGSCRWEQATWHDCALPSWKQRRARARPLIIPAVLLLSCAAVEFALGLLLSTMPLYFREETDSSLLYSAVDMSRVVSSLIVLTALSRLPEKASMPFQIKMWCLCLLFTGGIITPSFRLLILAVAGHVLCGVAYNLLGPAIHSELILCLKESQLNIWVAMKELVTLACGAAGSAFGTWAFSAGLTGLVFSIPAGVLVLAPVLYTLGHCQAWLKEDEQAAEAAAEEEAPPSRRTRFSIYPGAVLEDTVASESFIAQEVADGPEGISCLRAKFGFDQNVLFGNLGISSLAIAFQALGHPSVDANKIVNGGKIPVCVAVEQDLSLKHVASLVQHLVLLNGWPLGCVHHMIGEHDDFDKFQQLLQEQLTKGVVLVNFEPFFDLSGVGKVKHRGCEGWAVAVRMTTKGMIELLVSHGIGGGVHLYAYNAPTAMLFEHCTRISPLSQRPRGVVVLGRAGQDGGGGALPPPMSSRWSSAECEKALISAAQHFGPVELQQPRNLCQVTSMVLALRFLGVPHISLDAVFAHTSLEISTVVREGLTLENAYGALRACIESMNLPYTVEPFFPDEEQSVFPDAMQPRDFEAFGKVLGRTTFPQLPVIVNFNSRIAHGAEDDMTMEGGHFAVAIWCDSEVASGHDGGVLILDPNPARYSRFWFCQASSLWRACCDKDSSSGRSRGLLMFEHCLRKSKNGERPASLATTALPTLMQIDRNRAPSVRRGAKLVTL